MKVEIEYIKTSDLVPYANNPRKNDEAVGYVAESIKQFGFKVPIVIDRNNVIIAGHTRLKASEMLGLSEVPCIRADDLTEDQVKAFRIADNKVSEFSTWDDELLNIELDDIEIDMESFGFDVGADDPIDEFDDDENIDDGWYGDERERTNRAYHLEIIDRENLTDDFWQMPIIWNDEFIPTDLIGFNYAKTSGNKDCGIHFFVDDYQFERVWNYPEKYIDVLSQYECILSPDFSLYLDMPTPIKIWNTYRSRQIGAFYQSVGLKVIPTISWAEQESFEYSFRGIPSESIVAVSTIGVKRDDHSLDVWRDGMDEMIKRIEPQSILIYGGSIDYDYKGIETHEYSNKVIDAWKERN